MKRFPKQVVAHFSRGSRCLTSQLRDCRRGPQPEPQPEPLTGMVNAVQREGMLMALSILVALGVIASPTLRGMALETASCYFQLALDPDPKAGIL